MLNFIYDHVDINIFLWYTPVVAKSDKSEITAAVREVLVKFAMNSNEKYDNPSPENSANVFSDVFLW